MIILTTEESSENLLEPLRRVLMRKCVILYGRQANCWVVRFRLRLSIFQFCSFYHFVKNGPPIRLSNTTKESQTIFFTENILAGADFDRSQYDSCSCTGDYWSANCRRIYFRDEHQIFSFWWFYSNLFLLGFISRLLTTIKVF